MPLETEEDFESLGEHLAELDAPLAAFAARHGYQLCPRLHGGRYPNRRLIREGTVVRSIHIGMDDMPSGERYDRFFPDIPYTIWGSAWIDDHEQHLRFHCAAVILRGVPFTLLARTLEFHLHHFYTYVFSLSEDYVRACAHTSTLRSRPV